MNKIPTMFKRDPDNRSTVLPEILPECQWVLDGEGVITRKWEGTCVMLDDEGNWWARREVKKNKTSPPNYMYISTDKNSGAMMGYEPIQQSSFAGPHEEALRSMPRNIWDTGTYELVGPKINGNPEGVEIHTLLSHDDAPRFKAKFERTFEDLKALVIELGLEEGWEGIVVHHEDGQRMAKLKFRDFKVERDVR